MRFLIFTFLSAVSIFLSGCATTVRSDVTAFHQWPADMSGKSFFFERSPGEESSLEYQHYEDQVRAALGQQGLSYAARREAAELIVDIDAKQTVRDVTVVEPVPDPFFYASPFYYGPAFGPFGHYGAFSPFWFDPYPYPYQQRQVTYPVYQRRLHMTIVRKADGKKLYEGTATSRGRNPELAETMPYLVDSLFSEFPGPSGVPRRVELKAG